jgi:hypothetical protein
LLFLDEAVQKDNFLVYHSKQNPRNSVWKSRSDFPNTLAQIIHERLAHGPSKLHLQDILSDDLAIFFRQCFKPIAHRLVVRAGLVKNHVERAFAFHPGANVSKVVHSSIVHRLRQTSQSRGAHTLFVILLSLVLVHQANAATLAYSTYFGGSDFDGANAVAVGGDGKIFVAGSTSSSDFPILNALQPELSGGSDGFITKFGPDGHLLFSTFFGGVGDDIINSIKLAPDGTLVLIGNTHSTDLPTTEDAFQPNYNGGTAFGDGDGFIARLSSDLSQLLYCSYFGGSGDEQLYALAIDSEGNVCVAGWTDSSRNFPLKNPLQPKFGGGDEGNEDGFIAKFDSTLTNLIFSTYFGGELRESDQKIAVDPAGFIYISGITSSTNFAVTPGAFQSTHGWEPETGPNWDGFVSKLKPDGSALVYSTYIGGPKGDAVFGLAVDAAGSAYLTGTTSTIWPKGTFPMGFQPVPTDSVEDVWIAKLKPDGSNFAWFTYLGGTSDNEWGLDVVLDKENNVYVSGMTYSGDFPIVDALQPKLGGTKDTFIAKVSPDGQKLIYSTYLGGSEEDSGSVLALDPNGNLIAVGQTASLNFPIQGGIQTTNATTASTESPDDAYIARITSAVLRPPLKIARSGANVLISWSTNFSGFTLESTASTTSVPVWSKVGATPLTFGDQFLVVQPRAGRNQFFRLRRQ